jgi:catechol 2,3-dioxygenase-like lactoylglutathione lyase family enzyme
MGNRKTLEIKAFVPARDFALSQRFYEDLGFTIASSGDGIAYIHHGNASFLLQDFYNKEHAGNFMMHLLVEDVDAWWEHARARDLAGKYGVQVEPPEQRPWGMRDFVLVDPTGVLWRIAQNVPPRKD